MKRILIISTLLFSTLFGMAQAVIEKPLMDEMNRRGSDEKIEVAVIMKAKYDREKLTRRAESLGTKAERRAFVVDELKRFTEASQSDLRAVLAEMQEHDMVTEPRVLWMSNSLAFKATREAIEQLARRNDIATIGYDEMRRCIAEEPAVPTPVNREITPNLTQVNLPQVWELGFTGQGVTVAVIDEGVNYNHLDLADHLWDGGEEFPLHGYDVFNEDNDPMDANGHGTHCSGTVCGDGTAGSQTGAAPDATLMCVKACDNDSTTAVIMAKGIEWAVEHGCDLFSMSLGMAIIKEEYNPGYKTLLRRTCEAALDAGVVGAVCAGNEGMSFLQMLCPIPDNVRCPASCPPPYLDPDQLENPGGLTCVIAVGAVNYDDQTPSFTSEGPTTWQDIEEFGDYPYNPGIGLIRPDICASGVDIKSLDYSTIDGYTEMTGTSQATPCVAGIIALMLQKNPELTPAEICRILEETSLKLTEHKNNRNGVGRVDALAAINAVPAWDKIVEDRETKVSVYPNPTMGSITIQAQGMNRITLLNVLSQVVYDAPTVGDLQVLDLGQYNAGIYLVRVVNENGVCVKQVSVVK